MLTDTQRKPQELLQKAVKEGKTKGPEGKTKGPENKRKWWMSSERTAQHVNAKLEIPKSNKYKNLNSKEMF